MGNTSREINKIVADAAKKKREMDKNKSVEEKTDFISTAVDDRRKLEENLKKEVKDHSKIFLFSIIVLMIVFTCYLIFQVASLYGNADKDEWKTASVRIEEYDKAKEFVNNAFKKYKLNLDPLFADGPLTWKTNAKLIIEGMKGAGYEVSSVTLDTKNKGSEALMQVTCSAQGKDDVFFFIIMENQDYQILKVEKPMESKTKK